MVGFLKDLRQLREIEWKKSHSWTVKFPDAPSPFEKWFPASDITIDKYIHSPLAIQTATSEFQIPRGSGLRNIRMTFYDDENNTLLRWFTSWVNGDILNDGEYVTSIDQSVRELDLQKLGREKEILETSRFWVFPVDTLPESYTSESSIVQYEVSFYIAKEL